MGPAATDPATLADEVANDVIRPLGGRGRWAAVAAEVKEPRHILKR
jgi:hypothetical protein